MGSNWSTGTVPGPNDNVVIDIPGVDLTVTYSAGGVLTVNNLLNTELLDVTSNSGAAWTGGLWTGSGTVEIDTKLAISGTADKIMQDGIALANFGVTTLAGTGNIVGQVGASITNEPGATFNIESDADITFPTGVGEGIFENGGTLIKSVGGTAAGDQTLIGGAQGFTFENSINELVDLPTSIPGDVQVLQGTLALGDPQNVALTEGGTFEVSANATLAYVAGQHNIVVLHPPNGAPDVIPSITGMGTLNVSGGSVQFYGTINIHEIDVSSGALLLQQNMKETAGTPQANTQPNPTVYGQADILNVSGGTFGGNGAGIFPFPAPIHQEELPALVVHNAFNWSGGAMSGTGRLVIDATVTTSTISTTATKSIDGGFGVDLLCTTIWTGSGTIDMNGTSVLYIHGGGTLWDQGNGTITQGSVDTNGGSVWNSGIFLKLDGTGTTTLGTGITFINDTNPLNFVTPVIPIIDYPDLGNASGLLAKLDIRTGTISMQGTSINRDDYLIHPGAVLSFDAGVHSNITYADSNDAINASILGIDGGGTINFGSVDFESDIQAIVDVPTAIFGTGTYTFDNTAGGAQRVVNATFNGDTTGTIGGNGTIEVGNSFLWNSGEFVGTGGTTSSLLIDTGATLTMAAGEYDTTDSYSIDNRGTIQWATSPGLLNIDGNFDQTSTGVFDSALVVGTTTDLDHLEVSGTVSLDGTLNFNAENYTPTDGTAFTLIENTGTSAVTGTFVGLPEGSLITVNTNLFVISYVGGDGNDVVLTSRVFPLVSIANPAPIVRAEAGTSNLLFTVSLSVAVNHDVTISYATADGTAIAGTDYAASTSTLIIPAGQTTGTITVPIIGTMLIEPTVTFTVNLTSVLLGTLGSPASATGTILDPNGPPVVTLVPAAYTVQENAGVVTITVNSTNPAIPCTVDYSTVNGTALAGVDYTATSGVLSLPAGVANVTFTIPIIDEMIDTGQKGFQVLLSNPQSGGATLGAASTASVIILDNDSPLPAVSIGNASVTEPIYGQTNAVFTVTLSAASTTSSTVDYTTVDGSALAGAKYNAQSGTLTFAPGQTTTQFSVPILSDFTQSTTETFNVQLSNPSADVVLGTATGTGTVLSQPLTTISISAGHPYRYIDSAGSPASIALNGPGTATLTYLGLPTNAAKQLVLNNTTAQSQLVVRPAQFQVYAVDLTVNGSIGTINAPSLNLLGDVNITGAVKSLSLGSLQGGNSVTIGAGAGDIKAVNASFNTAINSTFTSALPLSALRASSWQDSAAGPDITAPSAVSISSSGDFAANVSLTGNLGTMRVAGTLSDSDILVGGNINNLTARSIINSDIFAGVSSGVTTLPQFATQFANTTSTIKRLTVTSHADDVFANTLIAAPIIGNVQLGSVDVSNGGTPFGVAASTIALVGGFADQRFKVTNSALTTSPFSDSDLIVRLT